MTKMPMSVDERAVLKTYMSRKLRTVPILILMLFSLLPLSMFTFDWVRGQLAWKKTQAEIVMINEDGGGFYRYTYEKTGESFSGTYYPYRVLVHYQIGKQLHVHDQISMAFNPSKPTQHVLFPKLELQMLTWAIVFIFCFIIYFWLEWVIKKRSKIKIAG